MVQSEPFPGSALEFSRRIKTGQRHLFRFLNPLREAVELEGGCLIATPDDVRVNLISRFDHLIGDAFPVTAGLSGGQLRDLFGLTYLSTCAEYTTIDLGDPGIEDQGYGWLTVEMPIVRSDYSHDLERTALTARIDEVLDEPDSEWYSLSPSLQIAEFRKGRADADQLLATIAARAPRRTELFDTSIRFRPAA